MFDQRIPGLEYEQMQSNPAWQETGMSANRRISEEGKGEWVSQKSEVDDLFDGEPDRDLYRTAEDRGLGFPDARRAFDEVKADDDTLASAQYINDPMASGGLGQGDTPHRSKSDGDLLQPAHISLHTLDEHRKSEDEILHADKETFEVSERLKMERAYHLAELTGEPIASYASPGNKRYSSSANSDSDSQLGDQDYSEASGENSKITDAMSAFQGYIGGSQRAHQGCASLVGKHDSGPSLCDTDGIESSASSMRSAVLYVRPYLSEVTPAEAQGQHPSIICRSPRRYSSRPSSLSGDCHWRQNSTIEGMPATGEPQLPGMDGLCPPANGQSQEILRSPIGTAIDEPHSSSPFGHLNDPNHSNGRSGLSPLRRFIEAIDTTGVGAEKDSSAALPSFSPARPDTPRPARDSSHMDVDAILPSLPVICPPHYPSLPLAPTSKNICSHRQSLNEWAGSGYTMHVSTSAPPLSGPTFTSSFLYGQSVQEASQGVPDTVQQSDGQAVQADIQNVVSSSRSDLDFQDRPRLDPPWEEAARKPDEVVHHPFLEQRSGCLEASLSDASSKALPHQPNASNDISNGARRVEKTSNSSISHHSSSHSPPPSPQTELRDAIHQTKRGSRKAPLSRRKATESTSDLRSRTVSASPRKGLNTATSARTPASGVQGDSIKIAKTRTTKKQRSVSRRVMTSTAKEGVDDRVPEVPNLPKDMDLDLPEMQTAAPKHTERATPRTPPTLPRQSAPKTPSRQQTETPIPLRRSPRVRGEPPSNSGL